MKKKSYKLEKIVGMAAYTMAKANINSACSWIFHQPKMPEAVKRLRKF